MHDLDATFETSDACLAATVVATVGAPLISVERQEEGPRTFVFAHDGVLDELAKLYEQGGIRVDPILFCAAQR